MNFNSQIGKPTREKNTSGKCLIAGILQTTALCTIQTKQLLKIHLENNYIKSVTYILIFSSIFLSVFIAFFFLKNMCNYPCIYVNFVFVTKNSSISVRYMFMLRTCITPCQYQYLTDSHNDARHTMRQ